MALSGPLLVKWSILILLVTLTQTVRGHGRLIDPPSRSTMWRYGFDNPINYNDMELFCGGFYKQYNLNHGKCGICGDPWDGPRENEAGGKYANGIIVRRYHQGVAIVAKVEITAHHKGYFEFRICPATDDITEVSQDCLDSYKLELADGSGTRFYLPEGSGNGVFQVALQLPYDLVCERCVFQWIYIAGNNWGICPDGSGKVGCGNQEQFRGCADVAVGGQLNQMGTEWQHPNVPQTVDMGIHHLKSNWHNPQGHHHQSSSSSTPSPSDYFYQQPHGHRHSHHQQHSGPLLHLVCMAVGPWTGDINMNAWCNANCNHVPPFCPSSHCRCH